MAVKIWSAASAGNWGTAANWSPSGVPAAGDTAQFGSGVGATQSNCTLDVSTNNLAAVDFTGYTGTFTHTAVVNLTVTTTFKLVAGMTYTTSTAGAGIVIAGNVAFTTAGKNIQQSVILNGGTLSLQDNWVNCSGEWQMNSGAVTTNGVTISLARIGQGPVGGGTISLGASAITLTSGGTSWDARSNWTVNAGTSTITCNSGGITFAGGGFTYSSVVLSGSGTATITGANTFANLTRTGTASQTDQLALTANQTVTGTLTLTGNSTKNRILIGSNSGFVTRTIAMAGAAISATNVDYRDITITGSPTQTITSVGDAGGNTGVTTTASSPQAWQSTSGGSFSVAGNWTSRIPLPQDDVTISKAFIASQTITMDMPRLCRNLDFTGTTGSPTLSITVGPQVFGSVTLVAGLGTMSWSFGMTMVAYSNVTLTTAGKQPNNNIALQAPLTSTLTLQDDLTISGSGIFFIVQGGTCNANGHNVTAPGIFLGQFGLAWAATMGSGTWTATGSGVNAFAANANGSLTTGTSTVVLSDTTATGKTFTGGGYTYNNVSFTGGGTGAITITGSNTFNTLTINAPKTVTSTINTTQIIYSLVIAGSSGNVITLNSTSASTEAVFRVLTQVSGLWVTVTDITAAGNTPFFVDTNSTLTRATNWVKASPNVVGQRQLLGVGT